MDLKSIWLTLTAVLAQSLGNVALVRGVRGVDARLQTGWRRILAAVSQPMIPLAVLFLATHFFLWLKVLSCCRLSCVVPLTASSYVINSILAVLLLKEQISRQRWTGTFIIAMGVLLILTEGKS